MIYLFRKFNKQIIVTSATAAWEMYSSNGNWKFRPKYLGALKVDSYHELKERVQTDVPISVELVEEVNLGDKKRDRELQALQEKRRKLHEQLLEELAKSADTSIIPKNMDIINRESLSPEAQKVAERLAAGMAHE